MKRNCSRKNYTARIQENVPDTQDGFLRQQQQTGKLKGDTPALCIRSSEPSLPTSLTKTY
ncbi:hypothetical protein DPMN_124959 [Dreissena polymorpha]|uniref:Uncharacterized protein n=1 Tax=Dreissena polymorpha TaxID=45954 RepID=A0A9D4JSM8_DREPO|nr:hypothetical protein DPMN_124959 [Dreissena polymorpha]